MYAQGQRIAKNSNVSSMIWGCQWDRALEWIVERNGGNYSLVTNSTEWGNHASTVFEYLDTDGTTKEKSTSKAIPTGSTERNKKNNIYDMAGNVDEWTLEAYNVANRAFRGGNNGVDGSSRPTSFRYSLWPTLASSDYRSQGRTLRKVILGKQY